MTAVRFASVLILLACSSELMAQKSGQFRWGARTSTFRPDTVRTDSRFVKQLIEPNGDTTLVFRQDVVGTMLVSFDSTGLYSVRSMTAVGGEDRKVVRGAFELQRDAMRKGPNECSVSEKVSPDSSRQMVFQMCPDSLNTKATLETQLYSGDQMMFRGQEVVVLVIQITEGANARDRRRRNR